MPKRVQQDRKEKGMRCQTSRRNVTARMGWCAAWGAIAALLMGAALTAHADDANEPAIPEFERVVIDDDQPERPWYKMVGDLTGDGELDAVVAGQHGPIVMYRPPDWEKIHIAEGVHDGGVRGEIADMNGNGRNDIVMGSVVWLENPSFDDGAWQGDWTVHRIGEQPTHDALVGDLTGNGLLDVVARDQSAFGGAGDAVHIFYQREPNEWEAESLDCGHGEGVALADISGDGQLDIIAGAAWFENASGEWRPHVFAPDWEHAHVKVEAGDINGNGRLDIVLTPAELAGEHYRISWFEAPAGDRTEPWTEHVIVEEVEAVVHALALADFNRNGALDIAYAEMHQGQDPDEVVVMLNRDNGAGWERLVIDTEGSHDIIAADMTGNGALDIFGANHDGDSPVVIWKNRLAAD